MDEAKVLLTPKNSIDLKGSGSGNKKKKKKGKGGKSKFTHTADSKSDLFAREVILPSKYSSTEADKFLAQIEFVDIPYGEHLEPDEEEEARAYMSKHKLDCVAML